MLQHTTLSVTVLCSTRPLLTRTCAYQIDLDDIKPSFQINAQKPLYLVLYTRANPPLTLTLHNSYMKTNRIIYFSNLLQTLKGCFYVQRVSLGANKTNVI